jgi:hypothetical protein
MSADSLDFLRAVVLKTAFCPVPLRKCQAALLYYALRQPAQDFTADAALPGELVGDDTHIAGIAVGSLAGMGLLERAGRCKSPAPSRNGCWVNLWHIGQRAKALTWLERNQFPAPGQGQQEMQLSP